MKELNNKHKTNSRQPVKAMKRGVKQERSRMYLAYELCRDKIMLFCFIAPKIVWTVAHKCRKQVVLFTYLKQMLFEKSIVKRSTTKYCKMVLPRFRRDYHFCFTFQTSSSMICPIIKVVSFFKLYMAYFSLKSSTDSNETNIKIKILKCFWSREDLQITSQVYTKPSISISLSIKDHIWTNLCA